MTQQLRTAPGRPHTALPPWRCPSTTTNYQRTEKGLPRPGGGGDGRGTRGRGLGWHLGGFWKNKERPQIGGWAAACPRASSRATHWGLPHTHWATRGPLAFPADPLGVQVRRAWAAHFRRPSLIRSRSSALQTQTSHRLPAPSIQSLEGSSLHPSAIHQSARPTLGEPRPSPLLELSPQASPPRALSLPLCPSPGVETG